MVATEQKIEVGTRLGSNLTVLGIIDDRSDEPVYVVWHHTSWCPMLCKVLETEEAARREADILSAFSHPNIVRCFGVEGSTCLLTEYLEGPNLHQLAKGRPRHRLGINDALRTSIYIGSALSHVHACGLLHLDIKPSNIVIAHGRPVLCDFGLARWQAVPRSGGVRGTQGYIAPEEYLLENVTPAADVFGLGVTLFELLTGQMPFPDPSDATPYPQTSQTPSAVRSYRPAVPSNLDRLILSCMHRDPKDRPGLAVLIPSLHELLRNGPTVWPDGFRP